MSVQFHKMHGAGNDFVLIDLRRQDFPIDNALAESLADRHTGIGCDQLLVLHDSKEPDCEISFEVWNADGSRAEQCGNGVRCIALYLDNIGQAPKGPFWIQGPVNRIGVEVIAPDQVRVNMGLPEFDPSQIPFRAEMQQRWYDITAGHHQVQIAAVSMGNPHAVMVVKDLGIPEIDEWGPAISGHPAFPQGCNAGFVKIEGEDNLSLRVFERGAGETLACGSGACAAVAVLANAGMVSDRVQVTQKGGGLMVECEGKDAPIMKTGPAVHLYEGNLL